MAEAGEFENWLAFADRDLQAATLLAASQHPLLEIVCFHCQQSAEKYLKAYLVRNTQEIKKTHDLRELCRACQVLDGEFNQLVPACIDLTDYAVETRYPYPLELESSDSEKALRDAQKVRDFVLKRVS